jgi:hypothetical protein
MGQEHTALEVYRGRRSSEETSYAQRTWRKKGRAREHAVQGDGMVVLASRCGHVPPDVLVSLLFVEHLMDESDGNRALPNRRRYTLHIAAPDVADREHAGQTRFQEVGSPGQRPTRGGHLLRG